MKSSKQPSQHPKGRITKIISGIIKGILLILLIAAFWLVVVMLRPETTTESSSDSASTYFMQNANITTTEELFALLNQATYPIMAYPYGMGISFESGTVSHTGGDTNVEVWSLNYVSANSIRVNVQTIYPNSAISRLNLDGMHLTSNAALSVSGVSCARLSGMSSVIYYGKSDDALYRIEIPAGVDENAVLQSLQLINHE